MYPNTTPFNTPFNTINPFFNNWFGGLPINGFPGNTWNTPFNAFVPGVSPINSWQGFNTPNWFGNIQNPFGGVIPGATNWNNALPFAGGATPWNWSNLYSQVPFNYGQIPFNGLTGGTPFAGVPFNTFNPYSTPFNGWFGGFVPNFGVNPNAQNGAENAQTNIPVGFGPFGLVYPCNGVVPQVKAA